MATVTHVEPQLSGMFLIARAKPAADLDRSDEVLLLRDLAPPVGSAAAGQRRRVRRARWRRRPPPGETGKGERR